MLIMASLLHVMIYATHNMSEMVKNGSSHFYRTRSPMTQDNTWYSYIFRQLHKGSYRQLMLISWDCEYDESNYSHVEML